MRELDVVAFVTSNPREAVEHQDIIVSSVSRATFDDREVQRLKRELYEARITLLDVMPEKIHPALFSFRKCSAENTYQWKHKVVEEILEHAQATPPASNYGEDRAYRPLCGQAPVDSWAKGFRLPLGLQRHLGNRNGCAVMATAMELAEECWDGKFRADRAERHEVAKVKEKRRTGVR